MDPNAKLFHYTKRESALEHILPSRRIRLSRLTSTNDPREFLPVLFGIAGYVSDDDGADLIRGDPFDFIEDADRYLRGSVRLLCLTQDRPGPKGSTRYGNGPLRARMWAQYAGNHSGVCLCFDQQRLLEAAARDLTSDRECKLFHRAVSYEDENAPPMRRPTLITPSAEEDLEGYVNALVEQRLEDFFFVKSWDWASETEYRILVRGETNEEEYIAIEDCLEAVIIGQTFPRVYWPALTELCEQLDATPMKALWDHGHPLIVSPGS